MKKICFVAASSMSLRFFMRNHMLTLARQFEVTAVANFSAEELSGDWLPGIRLVSIPIARQISLFADLRVLIKLLMFFRVEGFNVVHSVTPKAGLLAMMAARLAGVPHRIHCFTGQVWATRRGMARSLLKRADCIIASNANHVLADSHSQLEFLEREAVVPPGQVVVLAAGSISGVDLDRFHPDKAMRNSIRDEWGLPAGACLLLFVGRLNRDKGVLDLAQAFAQLADTRDDVWLAVVGPDEAAIDHEFESVCGSAASRVRRIGYTAVPEQIMAAADIFVLPSYREGFGSVVIEAAACGLPAVVSRIYGLTDAVEENVTGLMHPAGDVVALRDCLARLCSDEGLRLKMGKAALERASRSFSIQDVTAALVAYYKILPDVKRV